ncbi:MAG TPA: hydrogenase subunit MbhD domain-containing protein [Candidatus Acidoferrales bacterium]|nr:hydrogenase subunit MbhD domain-containing protein [Candidatus Acidoferrales bacterium]
MSVYQAVIYALIAIFATVTVLTRDPKVQIFPYAFYGMLLAILFFILQAPDVTLSELAVGTALIPFLVLVTLAKMRARER